MTKKKTHSSRFLVYGLMVAAGAIVLMSFGRKEVTSASPASHWQRITTLKSVPDIAPVDLTKVTKVVLYGNRMHPILKEMRNHTGIDFELKAGSEVFATADGVVVIQRYGDAAGNVVRIQHDATYHSRYYHLERALVKVGDQVKKGQVIGLVGNTGLSSVPHLHYEVLKSDVTVDPKDYLPALPSF